MATPSEIRLAINGVDNTAGAFAKAKAACRDFAADIRRVASGAGGGDLLANAIGGLSKQVTGLMTGSGSIAGLGSAFASCGATALAALGPVGIAVGAIGAGVSLAAKNCAKFAREMSALTDVAQRAHATSGEIQKLAQAMSRLGIKGGDVEGLANAMAHMTRTAGAQGAAGFLGVLDAISQVEDAQQRAIKLNEVFGRTGESLQPLVERHGELLAQLVDIANGYDTASERAMDAGDRMADAMADSSFRSRQVWYSFWGEFLAILQTTSVETGSFWEEFQEGARQCLEVVGGAVGGVLKTVWLVLKGLLEVVETTYYVVDGLVRSIGELFSGEEFGTAWKADMDAISSMWDNLASEWNEMFSDMWNGGAVQAKLESDRLAGLRALQAAQEEAERKKSEEEDERYLERLAQHQERLYEQVGAFWKRYDKIKRDALAMKRELDSSPKEVGGLEYGTYASRRIESFARAQMESGALAGFADYFSRHDTDDSRANNYFKSHLTDLLESVSDGVRAMVSSTSSVDERIAALTAL